MTAGAFINVGSRINDAYSLINAGLPVQIWEAVGASIFFISVIFLLYRWDRDRPTLQDAAAGRALPDIASPQSAPGKSQLALAPNRRIPQVDVEALTKAFREMYSIIHEASRSNKYSGIFKAWRSDPREYLRPNVLPQVPTAKEELNRLKQQLTEFRTERNRLSSDLGAIYNANASYRAQLSPILSATLMGQEFEKTVEHYNRMLDYFSKADTAPLDRGAVAIIKPTGDRIATLIADWYQNLHALMREIDKIIVELRDRAP
jgi:hypothetical protein